MTILTPACNRQTMLLRRIFFVVLFAMAALCLQAQKNNGNSLLWKVTGKDLAKPSYLFGTIHVQDKRVFNFSDSLYKFLQAADGFAMEIHPDSVVMAILQQLNESVKKDYLKEHLKKDEFDKLNKRLKKELGINADKLTIRDAYLIRQHLAKPETRADDMPTIVDAYLYGMAKNQGKEIAGLEKAIDQVKLLNDLDTADFNPAGILKSLKKDQTLVEKLIQLYIREDLKSIGEMMSVLPDRTEDKLLNLRNHIMVDKMDSLMRQKSFVVAVGTAHLPGAQGMITLLRQKGYTVEPVYTTTRTHANKYAIKAEQRSEWVHVKEPTLGYSARMPGKPSPMAMLDGAMKMNLYIDMTSMKQYYTAFVLPGVNITSKNADSVLKGLHESMVSSSSGESISDKRFSRDGFEAIDVVYKIPSENVYTRVQSFAFGKRVYMVGMGAKTKDELYGKDATDYFNGFTIEKIPEQLWQQHTLNEHFMSVSLPEMPKMEASDPDDSTFSSVQYNAIDHGKGNLYSIIIITTAPGFVMPDDSTYFANAAERFTSPMKVSWLKERDTMFQGFRAKWIMAELDDHSTLKYLTVNRGNRIYSLVVTGTPEDSTSADIAKFFNSFSLIEYPVIQWKEKKLEEHGFTVRVPGDFDKTKFLDYSDSAGIGNREFVWTGYDSTTATSFTVTRRTISPYLWAKHDSILLKRYMKNLAKEDEILGQHTLIKSGSNSGIDFDITKRHSVLVQRNRVLLNGKFMYILQAEAPRQYWDKYELGRFAAGFRFHKEEKTDFIRTNSLNRLLTDLRSRDSATYSESFDAISDVLYDSTDIPALLKAATDTYPLDTLKYRTVQDRLLAEIRSLKHENIETLVADHYQTLTPDQDKSKFSLLSLLSKKLTDKSYTQLASLLNKPAPKSDEDIYQFMYGLYDSLQLTKKLYPRLIELSVDTVMSTPLFSVHKRMLDSSVLSIDDLRTHEALILQAARHELVRIDRHKEKFYYALGSNDLIEVLGKLKSPASIAMLREFMSRKFINVKLTSAIALLKIKQAVDPAVLMTIAENNSYRVRLYEELRDLKMEQVFPAKYLNQRSFAEGYVASDLDHDIDKVEFVGEKISVYKGKLKKFYLFKVTVTDYEGDSSTYLAVSGPFHPDPQKIVLENDISGVCDEEFDQKKIDEHFREFLKGWEEFNDEDDLLLPGEK